MAISLLDNLNIRKKRPNVERDLFDTISDMVAYSENYLPEVFECNVKSTGERYRYNVNNEVLEGLGKWRLVLGGESSNIGEAGFSPTIVENSENTDEIYKLDITDKNGTFTTPNLKGEQGIQGSQGERGEQGIQGEQGEKGFSPTITENEDNTEDVYKLNIINEEGTFTTPNLKAQGTSGTSDHNVLENRNMPDQHPIKAITGLNEALQSSIQDVKMNGESVVIEKVAEIKIPEVKNFFKINATRMIAHRGRSNIAPENTIPAYELAGDFGYWGGEVDIQKTKDGYFVCIHDGTVDRTTNGTGSVANMTLAEVQALYIKAQTPFMGNAELYPVASGEAVIRVPTLEQYLETCKRYNVVPVIELKEETLKSTDMASLLVIVDKWEMTEQVIFIGFNDLNTNLLETLHSLNPKVHCQPILNFTKENIDYVAENFAPSSGIDPAYGQITKELVDYAHSKGVEVNCWTCDDDTEKERLMECGVDYITTNSLINSKLPEMKTGALNYELGGVDRVVDIIQKSFELQAEASPNLIYCQNPVVGNHNIYDYTVNHEEGTTPYSRAILSTSQLIGDEVNMTKRALDKTKYYINEKTIYLGGLDFTKYKMTLLPFNEKGLFIVDMGWFTSSCFVALPDNTSFVLFYFATTDGNTDITAEDLENFKKAYIGRNGNRRYIRLTDGDFCFVTKLNDNLASLGKTELQLSDMTAGFLSGQPTNRCWCFKPINTIGNYPKVKVHYTSSDYAACVYAFKRSSGKLVYTEDLDWAEDGAEITLTSGTERIYLAFKKSDSSVMSQKDFINIANNVLVEIY